MCSMERGKHKEQKEQSRWGPEGPRRESKSLKDVGREREPDFAGNSNDGVYISDILFLEEVCSGDRDILGMEGDISRDESR